MVDVDVMFMPLRRGYRYAYREFAWAVGVLIRWFGINHIETSPYISPSRLKASARRHGGNSTRSITRYSSNVSRSDKVDPVVVNVLLN